MATLWVSENDELGQDSQGNELPLWKVPPTKTQSSVTFTTAAQSAAFSGTTTIVRLYASAAFHLAVGSNPTATAANDRYAGTTEYFIRVAPGQKLSVYDGSS